MQIDGWTEPKPKLYSWRNVKEMRSKGSFQPFSWESFSPHLLLRSRRIKLYKLYFHMLFALVWNLASHLNGKIWIQSIWETVLGRIFGLQRARDWSKLHNEVHRFLLECGSKEVIDLFVYLFPINPYTWHTKDVEIVPLNSKHINTYKKLHKLHA
jgi:hypothetical protein